MPSKSFYNKSRNQMQNSREPSSNRSNNPLFNKKLRKSNMSMKRVDKISRVSVDQSKNRNSKQPQKTNFHGIFDAIMNNSNNRSGYNNNARNQRNKSGLLSRGFMPNKSKGSLGAMMGRDKIMGNIQGINGPGRKKRALSKRNVHGQSGHLGSKGKFGLDIFGPKRSIPKRRAYFD
jgi:hypothetical protein